MSNRMRQVHWPTIKQFIRFWALFTIQGTVAQIFGWLAVAGALLAGFFPSIGLPLLPEPAAETLKPVAIGAIIGFGVYALLALRSAYIHTHPLSVCVSDQYRSPDFSFNETVRGHSAALVVTNRADRHLVDCVAYVLNAPMKTGGLSPRFVEKFDLPRRSKRIIYFAYWFERETPSIDDRNIGLSGPVGGCWDGNECRTSGLDAELQLRVSSPEAGSVDLLCRVWVDGKNRRLRCQRLPPRDNRTNESDGRP